jgi:arginine-tRNA-protein transferase
MLRLELNIPSTDESRLRLFNLHRLQRNLSHGDTSYTEADYEGFLVESCCTETVELSFWKDDQLVAVSIIDCGLDSLSAVYTYFDPGHSQLSLGSYSVLKQMQLAQATDRRYVYLGMYVAANSHLNYKSRFRPQERYINSHWIAFE